MRLTFTLCTLMMLSGVIAAPMVHTSRDESGVQNFRIVGNPTPDSESSNPKRAMLRDVPQNFRMAGNPTPDSLESGANPKRALEGRGGENFRIVGNPTPDSQTTPKRELESRGTPNFRISGNPTPDSEQDSS